MNCADVGVGVLGSLGGDRDVEDVEDAEDDAVTDGVVLVSVWMRRSSGAPLRLFASGLARVGSCTGGSDDVVRGSALSFDPLRGGVDLGVLSCSSLPRGSDSGIRGTKLGC